MAITFPVHNVKLAPPLKTKNYYDVYGKNHTVSGCDSIELVESTLDPNRSNFYRSVALAYNYHYPLVLSPNNVWITLLQGFSKHINDNPHKYKKQLGIDFDGKQELKVFTEPSFLIKDSKDVDWIHIVEAFSKQIKDHVSGNKHSLFMKPFSTTTAMSEAATAITMMGTYQSYFSYSVMTLCGIPHITLEGSKEDWQSILERVYYFSEFDLEWWVNPLSKVLQKFVDAFNGNTDLEFWKRIYNQWDASGDGEVCSGWLVTFFPYINGENLVTPMRAIISGFNYKQDEDAKPYSTRNLFIDKWDQRTFSGVKTCAFPDSIIQVPFIWNHFGEIHKMVLSAGLVGLSQKTNSLALRAEAGFAVDPARS